MLACALSETPDYPEARKALFHSNIVFFPYPTTTTLLQLYPYGLRSAHVHANLPPRLVLLINDLPNEARMVRSPKRMIATLCFKSYSASDHLTSKVTQALCNYLQNQFPALHFDLFSQHGPPSGAGLVLVLRHCSWVLRKPNQPPRSCPLSPPKFELCLPNAAVASHPTMTNPFRYQDPFGPILLARSTDLSHNSTIIRAPPATESPPYVVSQQTQHREALVPSVG
ncbi:uncharacterized protein BDR25DRAFT_348896 [Lindgomyces ingoldianus]|uniref:Uncharacterized protein n=1 Tax=Lindgomyces ingoldianus TaxID=673940 RepID=A0ACB6RCD8_9PLEO|nr:uncharacterized protein BDR25DRAFT_348896 [Lindgomyces ingoldianus]KAF2476989.1 hypothetical protein BDR25DRAFT_348896 [Lindgomyces ingoldianus]